MKLISDTFVQIDELVDMFNVRQQAKNAADVAMYINFLIFLSRFADPRFSHGHRRRWFMDIFSDQDREDVRNTYHHWGVGVALDSGGEPYLSLQQKRQDAPKPIKLPALKFATALTWSVAQMAQQIASLLRDQEPLPLPQPFVALSEPPSSVEELRRWVSLADVLSSETPWKVPPVFFHLETVFSGPALYQASTSADRVKIYHQRTGKQSIVWVDHVRPWHQNREVEFYVAKDAPPGSVPQRILTGEGLFPMPNTRLGK